MIVVKVLFSAFTVPWKPWNKTVNCFQTFETFEQSHMKKKSTALWINPNNKKRMKELDLTLKSAVKMKLSQDRHNFTTLQNRVVKELRLAKANFFFTIIKE